MTAAAIILRPHITPDNLDAFQRSCMDLTTALADTREDAQQ